MDPDTKGLLKSTGKLLGSLASELFNGITLQIPKTILEQHVEKKVAERLKPELKRIPPQSQQWKLLKIGMSEKEVGHLLGVPDYIAEEFDYDTGQIEGIRWEYNPPFYRSGQSGLVVFSDRKLIRFRCQTKNGHIIEGYLYVGLLGGNIFHFSDRSCVKRIQPENLIGFVSRTHAINNGYKPCAKCNP